MKKYEGKTQIDVKIDNQRLILNMLYDHGPMSRADLAKALNSSKPTVSKNVVDLQADRRIIEIGKADNKVGKKAMLLDVNPEYAYVLAIDLSKESIKAVVADVKGNWLSKVTAEITEDMNLIALIDEVVKNSGAQVNRIKQIVIAYPGVVGHNDVYYLTNVKQKEVLLKDLVKHLEKTFAIKPLVKNDVNLGVMAEQHYGSHNQDDNLYYISGDMGIGSGIFLNRRLYTGDRNAAGEIGFILPSPRKDGVYHTLEERNSIQALSRRYNRRKGIQENFEFFCEQVTANEPEAKALYEELLANFSVALTNVSSILDIKNIVVTGRLFEIQKDTVEVLNKLVEGMTPFDTKIVQSTIEDGTLKGAALVGTKALIKEMA